MKTFDLVQHACSVSRTFTLFCIPKEKRRGISGVKFTASTSLLLFVLVIAIWPAQFIQAQCVAEICNGVDDDCDSFIDEYAFSNTTAVPFTSTASSDIAVSGVAGTVTGVRISELVINHTWIGDLSLVLRAPNGQTITLLDRPGIPASTFGCSGDNISVSFSSNAAIPAENQCNANPPAISGNFLPVGSFSTFNGLNPNGNWTLLITDNFTAGDNGTLIRWSLELVTNVAQSCCPAAGNIWYVKETAAAGGTGTSWQCAFKDLQLALAAANSGDQIWVAAGTYKPTSTTDRNISFAMKNGVGIYGGFNGTETQLSQRNWRTNVTILSGDINQPGSSDNSYHVVSNNNLNNSAVLNGFTITAGNASGMMPFEDYGGAMFNVSASPQISNCIFVNNHANTYGGAIFNVSGSNAVITNCIFTGNSGGFGKAVANFQSGTTYVNCSFVANTNGFATLQNIDSPAPSYINCISWGNGEEIANFNSTPLLSNTIIQGGYSPCTNCPNGNGNANPLFVNAAGGDFRLQGCSPAVNVGSNAAVPSGTTTDLDGNPRFYNNGTVDIGAYEFQSTPPFVTCYRDSDNDSFGNPAMSQVFCNTCGTGYVSNNTDCNDANSSINPLASESCDGIDNNCNSQTDEGNVCCPTGNVLYVKANASGANNGASWTDAFNNLQDALNSACPGITEIWVAAGTYKPTSGTDRSISFVMKNGVAIYGGFNGTEAQLLQRNWVANVTTLSGDIGAAGNNGDNTRRVINNNFNAGNPLTSSAILDGFTVEAGNADGAFPLNLGGGMWNTHASPTVRNCIFKNNTATSGAAIFNDNSQANVTNCLFIGNSCSVAGAAMSNGGGTALTKVTNCTFYGNTGGNSTISNEVSGTTISNCVVWGNANGVSGGTVTYSIVQGGFAGTGNLNTDPLFVNAAGGDFSFQNCSPAINAGSNAAVPAGLSTDLNRNPRFFNNGIVDMGAYEYQDTPNLCLCSNQRTWTGTASTDWNTDTNWNPACVPTANDHAIIPFATNAPVIQAGTAALAKSVLVQAGAVLTLNAMGSLTINNSAVHGLDNYGTVDNSGAIIVGNTTAIGAIGIVHRNGGAFNNKPGGYIQIDRVLGAQAFYSNGLVNNEGAIEIGSNAAVSGGGILVEGNTFNNKPGGNIQIDSTGSHAIQILSTGTILNNEALIEIGSQSEVRGSGIRNGSGCTFNNRTGGDVRINRIGIYGTNAIPCIVNFGTFTNDANITVGNGVLLHAQDGIFNAGSFTNSATGVIDIEKPWANGIWNSSGTFQNTGKITISNIFFFEDGGFRTGILSSAPFSNHAGAEIHIDQVAIGIINRGTIDNDGLIRMGENAPLVGSGIANIQGAAPVFNNNAGGDISIKQTAVNGVQNDVNSTFNNNACATLSIFDNLNNSGTFTNAGLFTVNTAQAHTNTALTNNGIIAYPQGNLIANVTNNEIIIAPTTANNCDAISPAFGLGSPLDFTIEGIFSDAAGTLSAGTYTTATNTFTPAAVLAEDTYTFYVKITDSGCTRIIPWQLTTQNCCDVPQALCKTAVISLVGNSASLAVDDVNNGSTADCGLQSIGVSPNVFNCSHAGAPQTVTLTITDLKGVSASCQTTVTVQDNTPPSITCPTTQTLALGANCTASLPDYTGLATAGDNCGVQNVTQSPEAGTTVSGADNMSVTLTVTDINGLSNTCSFTVTKVDNTAPMITCPATQTLTLGANCSASLPDYTGLATAGDNCGVQNVTQSPEAGTTVSGAGNMTVTLTVTDINGLTNSCTFTVTKVDNTAPSITCPTTQTLTLGANCSATLPNYTSLATTGDNCGVQNVTQSPAAGTTVSGAGNMSVTLTVTDINGLSNTCTFTVTKVDNTAPTITCPATQTLAMGANCSASLPDYTNLATPGDNCGVQSVMQLPEVGTTVSGAGNMSVTLTVTDINGLTNTCTFTITKVDNIAPTITCPATQTLTLGANCSASLPDYTNLATTGDNCGVQGVTQSPEAGTTVSGAGNMSVTLTVTDVNGLTNSCTFTVTKVDNTAPTVQCFNQTLNFNGEESIALDADDLAEASDNCGVQGIGLSPNNISAAQVGQIIPVTVTATDINGNTSTCTAQVTVSGLPAGWSQQPGGAGCAGNNNTYNPANGLWTATSSNCFYGPPYTADATSFAQRTLCGDGGLTVQVMNINGNGWAGLVMRESNASGAKKAQLLTNLSSLHRREFRTTTNGAAVLQQSASNGRHWLRIVRAGNQFSLFASANGTTWYLVGAQNIAMGNCIEMGLVATNYTSNSTVTATFSNVSFTGSNSSLGSPLTAHSLTPLHSPLTPDFEVYPNPTGGDLNVDLTQYVGRAVRMEVYSLEGKLLQFREIDEMQTTVEHLSLSQYANGMYFVKVQSRELPAVMKRVVLNR